MSIIQIRNAWLRRSTIVVAFVPFLLASILWGAATGAAEYVVDLLGAVRSAWRGRQP